MASAFTHAVAGLAIGTVFRLPLSAPARFWAAGAAAAAIPDLDGIGFWLGVPYDSMFGHRGFTHSLAFAAVCAAVLVALLRDQHPTTPSPPRFWLYLFVATASHGVLDAMTTGGGGVAFLAPFTGERWFFPWRPILVSPMSPRRFFTARGLRILASEARWVWAPMAALVAGMALRWRLTPRRAAVSGSR